MYMYKIHEIDLSLYLKDETETLIVHFSKWNFAGYISVPLKSSKSGQIFSGYGK